ncbi:MFS transporter, ACS family [Cupriavidus necator]|uniref:MFS transporter n=1 Tax=Cupriavidus necator (strain ATCC 17699 / DSM 428 / KCTC 22496 / NCIMB 10442 / H16 / Stanier 337) TaxID=381666 RepID=Q0KFJ9_CUPNH|nr:MULTISPECIES: MFS transporter [Cupriavidus]EON19431.1 major facilitator superfamily transporter ACS family protein [Cupriavidus sp. GA3-3]KUE88270.1 MFS transporter [Cupriavidus necator]QCB99187.1 MFS transporter [Cupriavidus necator H16]QQB77996.1 MFS transporter [Cupriavidus necator]WKA41012.1 MFS transporter [Cupriavidus necator]
MQTTSRATVVTEAKTSVRWKIFLMMLFLIAINYIDRASLSVAMPLIAKEFDLSPTMQGLILSSFFWTYALMQVPGGMLADKYKPRIVIACATVFWGIAQAVAAFTTNATALLLTRLGLGAAEAPIYPAGGKLNAIWMTQNERGRGATLLDGGAPLGAALGAIIITWLIATLGSWRLAFIVAGVGTVLAGVLAWYYVRNSPREHRGVNELEARYIEEAQANEHRAEPANLSGRSLDFFKYRSVWCMAIGWMCFNTVFYGLLTWMPNYLNKVHGFDIKQMGGASFIIFFSGFVGELIGGWIADKWKEAGGRPNVVMRTLFGIAAVVATVSIFSVAYVTDPIVVVVLLSSTLFFLRWCGLFWCVPSMLGTRNKIGFLGGVMNLGGNIGGITVPIIVGMIVQFTGSYFLALMFFAAAGVGLLLASTAIDYETKIPV